MEPHEGSSITPISGSEVVHVKEGELSDHLCPKCGSDIITGDSVNVSEGAATLELSCLVCQAEWQAIFVFEGVYLTDEDRFLWMTRSNEIEDAGPIKESQTGSLFADLVVATLEGDTEEANRLSGELEIDRREFAEMLEWLKEYSIIREEG